MTYAISVSLQKAKLREGASDFISSFLAADFSIMCSDITPVSSDSMDQDPRMMNAMKNTTIPPPIENIGSTFSKFG